MDAALSWSQREQASNWLEMILPRHALNVPTLYVASQWDQEDSFGAIAVYEGYHAVPTAEGVGRATTRTVVTSSVAVLAIVPMQDLLGLGTEARMNTPGKIEGNWAWRFAWRDVPEWLGARCRHWNGLYGRL